ncbi:MAG: leucyl aminopeptidase, partial [Lachnospiraceae bacterium]|nr:leucyl aminopeptidase [Lachnospiraceae bacterium]
MQENMTIEEKEELEAERFSLAYERIAQIPSEDGSGAYQDYFRKMAEFVLLMKETWDFIGSGALRKASLEELAKRNRELYADILPENYGRSYANPSYAAECFGKTTGQLLSFVYAELRGMIAAAYEQSMRGMVIRMELLLEIYQIFLCEEQEGNSEELEGVCHARPFVEEIRKIAYWYVSDYYEPAAYDKVAGLVCPQRDFATRIVMESDLSDIRYLYYYGEYVSENEIRTAEHLNGLPDETIKLMADTYTEGYRIGFEVCNKDISIKKTVNIRYSLGFERMIRAAVLNFEKMGLKPTIYRSGTDIFQGRSVYKNGYSGANPNKQFDYDHKEDCDLFLDKQLAERRLECMQTAFEQFKAQ